MRLLRSFPLCVLSGTLLCGTAAISQEIAPAARIVNPIDESQLVTLKGTVHPLANARNDRGAAPDEMQLERCTSSSAICTRRERPAITNG